MNNSKRTLLTLALSAWCLAQDPTQILEALVARQGQGTLSPGMALAGGDPAPSANTLPMSPAAPEGRGDPPAASKPMMDRLEAEIRQAKAAETGPRRFAEDLFDFREIEPGLTDGGISDDYVLGVGDRLQLSVFGSATVEVPVSVDGRGSIVLPRIGTVQVAGVSLSRARMLVEAKVRQVFSRAVVDLSVTKLREVRVFVLGEVYRPGGFLVPNLSSIVNVLSLSGGPTPVGSFRRIRIIRGGNVLQAVDLYPLRAEGKGNFNVSFQNGDTVFVPLMENQIRMEGAFTRVVATMKEERRRSLQTDTEEQKGLKRQIRALELSLGLPSSIPEPTDAGLPPEARPPDGTVQAAANPAANGSAPGAGNTATAGGLVNHGTPLMTQGPNPNQGLNRIPDGTRLATSAGAVVPIPPQTTSVGRAQALENIEFLKSELALSKSRGRGDKRIPVDDPPDEMAAQPTWLSGWLAEGKVPAMLFEMLPGETVKDAVGFAGNFALQSFAKTVSLKRITETGALDVIQVAAGEAMEHLPLQRGDVLMAMPQRDLRERQVTVTGWARVQGTFARSEGLRVGDLLRTFSLILPDTYLGRGEIVRTSDQETKTYLAFDVTRALAGDPGQNLLLQDRDELNLYRLGDLRIQRTLTVAGPVARPGTYEYLEGMRASDLLFRAGVPLLKADRLVAELAHFKDGKFNEVKHLDLTRLLSSETGSPVDLKDEESNPVLRPFDQLTLYAKPEFKTHRLVTLSGQVVRPGPYELDGPAVTLRDILARAGGLTPEAMVSGGVFLRTLSSADSEKSQAAARAGVTPKDPTSNGINEILDRLNETKRMPLTGTLLTNPLLHGLASGSLNRMVVNFPALLAGDPSAEVTLEDGDEVIFPRKTEVAYVVGETASPFGAYKVAKGTTVKEILNLAGGPTRNADTSNIRLLKADGRIVDRSLSGKLVEPGDAILVPQRIPRDVTWQENLSALTPVSILLNALRR